MSTIIEKLQVEIERSDSYIRAYLEDDTSVFTFPFPDLFGKRGFGYRSCGYVTVDAGKAYFRLPLRPYPWTYRTALTISLLTKVLRSLVTKDQWNGSNQDMILMVLCDRGKAGGHGHALGGFVSQRVLAWVKSYAEKTNDRDSIAIHPAIIQAEQATWHTINPPDMQKYASRFNIRSKAYQSGAFILTCFGDACDVGVYPSNYSGNEAGLITLDSHNLDTDCQQLTLLAGLAKLCQLVRSSS